jgi:hypothetical protein
MANYNADANVLATIIDKQWGFAEDDDILVVKDTDSAAKIFAGNKLFSDLTDKTSIVYRAQAQGEGRIEYDSTNYLKVTAESDGDVTLTPVGDGSTHLYLHSDLVDIDVGSGVVITETWLRVKGSSAGGAQFFLWCPNLEDGDGTRESQIHWRGTQTGGEESTLAMIQGSHDGASDDEKGDLIFYTNDGTDAGSPTERLRIDSAGNVGIGEIDPAYSVEISQASPVVTLHNTTHEDGAGGRLCAIGARGEQSGGEESTLGSISFSHDGSSDDQKGKMVISVNDGDDGAVPTECLRIDSAGLATFAGDITGGGVIRLPVSGGLLINGIAVVGTQEANTTTQLTTITHTAPGTPDYAIQNLTNSSPYGFVSQDEGNTVLSVIANLQTIVAEVVTKLKTHGLIASS